VAAALRWPEDPGLAIEKAARIRGDSDSVACLAGALPGAALGTAAIPTEWRDTLPQSEQSAGLSDRLIGIAS
jgi:ADP-ribosylglycohydrolase